MNARKVEEGQKRQFDRGALRGESCTSILEKRSQRYAGFRPDLCNEGDSCTVTVSDRFNMEYKRRVQDDGINGVEQKVAKFFQTPVEIDEARTMSREVLRIHGQQWILATDGSLDPRSNGPAGWGVFVLSPSGLCWLFCGATETDRELDEWHGEEDHTNTTGELKAMLVAHLFLRNLQDVASWQEARHEAPSQRLRDTRNVTVMGHEWSNPLPKSKKARTV